MKLKTIALCAGAIIASSFAAPVRYAASNPADAADAVDRAPQAAITVPEFVPIVNFSEFVLATEQFASENRPAVREAAQVLSAKFASASEDQTIELHPAPPQQTPAIVASALSPPVPDPGYKPTANLADPVKVASVASETMPVKSRQGRRLAKDKAPTGSRSRLRRRFQPAMGLGMTVDSAEDMPRPSSFTRSTKTIYTWNGSGWSAAGKEWGRSRR